MKSFKTFLNEVNLPKAESVGDLLNSIKDGRFTKDGAHLSYSGGFYCGGKDLISLVGCLSSADDDFNCRDNKLISLEGAPSSVGGHFGCTNNILTSLAGAPSYIGSNFYCSTNNLSSLQGIHSHIKETKGIAVFSQNPIKSHVLGLLKIKNLKRVVFDNSDVQDIINKYLPEGNMLDCIDELTDAGFEEFAKL